MNSALQPLSAWQQKTALITQRLFVLFAFCVPISLAVENISFILTLLCALISGCWWKYRKQVFINKLALFIGLLMLLFVVGLFYSDASWDWKLRVLKKEGEIFCILFLLPLIPYDNQFVLRVIKAFVCGGMVVVLIAWLGKFGWLPNLAQLQHPAPYYIFFKIYAALFMAFAAYLSLYLTFTYWKEPRQRYVWLICGIFISYNVLWQSISRTGYIIFFILALMLCCQHIKTKKVFVGLVLIAMFFLFALSFSTNLRTGLEQASHNERQAWHGHLHTSTGVRFGYLLNTIKLWKMSPVLGHGTGSYRYWSVKIHGIDAKGDISNPLNEQTTPENTYYRILVEHGLVGEIVWICFWLWQLIMAFKMDDVLYRHLALSFIVTMFIASMSQDLLLDESPRLFYILFTCLLYSPIVMKKLRGIFKA